MWNGLKYAEEWEEDFDEYTSKDLADIWKSRNRLYDGLIVSDQEFGGTSYVVFSAARIKSATGNAGTYGNENPSILFQDDEEKTSTVVDIDPEIIVDENDSPIDLENTVALRKWIIKKYQGKTVRILDDNERTIQFTTEGLKDSLKRRNKKQANAQRQGYANLDELLEKAVYDDYINADDRHPQLNGQFVYYSAARIGKKQYAVKFKVDDHKTGITPSYKDHKITEIEIAPSLYAESPVTNDSAVRQDESAISEISLAVLKGDVKPSRIEGTTLFQDDELAKFIENAPGIIERAAGYETAEEFRKDYNSFEASVGQGSELADKALKKDFYGILHQAAKEGRDPQDVAAEKAGAGEEPSQSPEAGEAKAGGKVKKLSVAAAIKALEDYGLSLVEIYETTHALRGNGEEAATEAAARLVEEGVLPGTAEAAVDALQHKLPLQENLWLKGLSNGLNAEAAGTILEESRKRERGAEFGAYIYALLRANVETITVRNFVSLWTDLPFAPVLYQNVVS